MWKGPYTVIDKCAPVDYKIQLIGGTQLLVVHQNRLKPCYGAPSPEVSYTPTPAPAPTSSISLNRQNVIRLVLVDIPRFPQLPRIIHPVPRSIPGSIAKYLVYL